MLEKIFDIIKNNLKNPKLYIGILSALLIFLVLFPYIDANFFYYQRINDRIDILQKISQLDTESISNNDILSAEYNSILSEIEKQADGSLGSVFIKETDKTTNLLKFLSGASIFWFLAIACLFMRTFRNKGEKFLGFIFCLIGGIILGFIAKAIPTIINPTFNYVGFPIIIVVVIALLSTSGKKKI